MATDGLAVGVLGAGGMGRNHVRVMSQRHDVATVHVWDPDPGAVRRATLFSSKVQGAQSLDDLCRRASAVVIATPTPTHAGIALRLLGEGKHVLIEKPLALTTDDAMRVVEAARTAGTVAHVGHIERHNPVVQVLRNELSGREVLAVEAHRLSLVANRSSDLITDLMLHDLDLVLMLAGESDPADVIAMGTWRDGVLVHAQATLDFGHWIASLTVSQVAQEKLRTLKVYTDEAVLRLDYVQQNMTVQALEKVERLSEVGRVGFYNAAHHVTYAMEGEPLAAEAAAFLDCIRGGDCRGVGTRAGAHAVGVSERVLAAVSKGRGR